MRLRGLTMHYSFAILSDIGSLFDLRSNLFCYCAFILLLR